MTHESGGVDCEGYFYLQGATSLINYYRIRGMTSASYVLKELLIREINLPPQLS